MRFSLILLSLCVPFVSLSQTKFFIGTDGDYSILIDENVKTKSARDLLACFLYLQP